MELVFLSPGLAKHPFGIPITSQSLVHDDARRATVQAGHGSPAAWSSARRICIEPLRRSPRQPPREHGAGHPRCRRGLLYARFLLYSRTAAKLGFSSAIGCSSVLYCSALDRHRAQLLLRSWLLQPVTPPMAPVPPSPLP
jgi:hypothetical protein